MISSFKLINYYNKDVEIDKLEPKSLALFEELLALLDNFKSLEKTDSLHAVWLSADRGTFEEWKKLDWVKEEYRGWSYKDLKKEFLDYYPYDKFWFKLITRYNNDYGFKAMGFGELSVCIKKVDDKNYSHSFEWDLSDLFNWLIERVKFVIEEVKAGTFNERIENELPYIYRYGVVGRDVYWKYYPEDKQDNFKDLSDEEIERFIHIAENELGKEKPDGRLKDVTFMQYFSWAATAYKAANYELFTDDVIKLFFRYGEDFGSGVLYHLDYNSPKDFDDYYNDRCGAMGGHPWGIRLGSSRTRIMLYPRFDNGGYYFSFSGDEYFMIYDIIKMYLALFDLGIPIRLSDPEGMLTYLREKDLIGIVPHSKPVIYQHSHFGKLKVGDFRHYNREEKPEFMQCIRWLPITRVTSA